METFKNFNDITRQIMKLRSEIFIEEQHVPIELEIEANEQEYIHCCLFLYDELVAYARVSKVQPFFIGRVCVKQQYRNQGFGAKIMKYAEAQIPFHPMDIFLHAQCQAVKFYESMGYVAFGDVFLEAGIEHISMKKRIV